MQTTTITPATAPDMKLFYVYFAGFIATSLGFIFRALLLPEGEKEFNLNQTKLGAIVCVDCGLFRSALLKWVIIFPITILVK